MTARGAARGTRDDAVPRVVFLTDIITPYSVAVLSALGERVALTALFCARSGTRGLDWSFPESLPFRYEVIGGVARRRPHADAADVYLSPRILAALRRLRPDAIISGAWSAPSAYAAIHAALRGVPLIIHSDGTSATEASINLLQRLSRTALVRAASAAAANSKPAAERFVELGFRPERVHLAPHSTNVEPFLRAGQRRDHGEPGRLRLLAIGRLIPRKGFDQLIAAYALAAERRPGISLRIVGSGPEEQPLRALAGQLGVAVDLAGFIDQPGLPAEYARGQAFAFPTLDDPFGIVLLEAAAAGLPAIASPHGGATADLLVDDVSGLVRDPRDVEATARAIVRLADDPELRRRLGEAAHRVARERTPEATANGYAEAVVSSISRGRPGRRLRRRAAAATS